MATDKRTKKELLAENQELRLLLEEAQSVLPTVRSGKVELSSEQRLARSILYQAGETIIVCDHGGRIIRASGSPSNCAEPDPMLQPFDQVLPLRLAESDQPFSIAAPIRGEPFENVEVVFPRNDGRTYYLVLNARALTDRQKQVIGCVVTLTDFTGRKQAEEEVRRSEERFRLMTDAMPALVWTIRPDGVIDYVNRQFLQLTGSSSDVVGAEGYSFPVHPEDRAATDAAYPACTPDRGAIPDRTPTGTLRRRIPLVSVPQHSRAQRRRPHHKVVRHVVRH